jgi:cytochrome c-type biogenesis protein
MGFATHTAVSAATVFAQGALSFFSPCVLPLIPLYVGYLAGGMGEKDENGVIHYPQKKVLLNTLFFVIGISFAFFLLGFGLTALGKFFSGSQVWFSRVSGVIILLLGVYQLGVFKRPAALEREYRLPFRLDRFAMNPLVALVLGFTFSFAWTPCVGPTLSSVLLMASSSGSQATGYLLIGVYTLGFVLPFLAVGFFTGTVLNFFKSHQNVVRYTVKIGAVLLIVMGVMTLTGFSSRLSTAQSAKAGETASSASSSAKSSADTSADASAKSKADSSEELTDAPDFTLTDQNGKQHKLSDYKGKTVFLNFWATWCGPCRSELPDIQKLYEKYGKNQKDLIVLGVAAPGMGNEKDAKGIAKFLKDNGYSYPVAMDATGDATTNYYIQAYPTTFLINSEGKIFGYVSGALSLETMEDIVHQTMTGKRTS